ncbi:unnamed protein product [Acanthoscelides obtectus]|uniref:Probable RNA polymerase II nuclear localization protein SLC7A6OS n=1 Tax=Acanthoscelides obtectus TaxID=200917 RepID=A0A9P0JIB6_ACAOB|nr:unnamed protein product [Acanthoscelides obtectus]CAK1661549.1 Probable RNA polymerase II nuclear localization protein SLC7A6OS [Acanthoscelides obtectus]
MAAIVRVKRRLDEEPLDALILNCKRRKVDGDDDNSRTVLASTILKFAGTIKKDENVLSHIKKQNIADLEQLRDKFKKHQVSINEKLRAEHQEKSKSNRYRIINCFRSGNVEHPIEPVANNILSEDVDKDAYTIFDIEYNTSQPERSDSAKQYVYDLYYTNSDDFGDAQIEDYVSIHPWNDSLMYGSARDNGYKDADSDDSEDSNAENNWRNDYPDESDMESINQDDMVKAVRKIDLGNDLSSDEGEEDYVYSLEQEDAYREEVDEEDVYRYGERYARFKAENKKFVESTGLDHDFYYGDIDENEYYY